MKPMKSYKLQKQVTVKNFQTRKKEKLIENDNRERTNEELDFLVTPTDSESSDREEEDKQHEGYSEKDLEILNRYRMTRTTPEPASPLQTSAPHQRLGGRGRLVLLEVWAWLLCTAHDGLGIFELVGFLH
ncbi:hypothetical protein AVEN_178440-1 [Araneus ventricosus]|uniref:Uncharacterized protein n=1 Tax=Araneus ventricosus TaxID=182803 RepID=A0A4Y2JFX6_ARAVE|nr:hypothetical protein AVEN_178440-1 [Araneus ventricosus]